MSAEFDKCPHCGQKVVKGAMRCARCGRLLITPEEQLERIERLKKSRKDFRAGGILKLLVFLAALAAAWYFFSDRITEFVRGLLWR